MLYDFIAIVCGIILLYKGGEWLCFGSVSLAEKFKVPRVVIGVTIVSFVTSAPELAVVLNANESELPILALSNIIGSNISNIGFILGLLILFISIPLTSNIKLLWLLMFIVSLVFSAVLFFDGNLNTVDGILLLIIAFATIFYLIRFQHSVVGIEASQVVLIKQGYKIILYITISGFLLWLGSEILVKGVNRLSVDLGISQRIVGLTIVAIGTSLPELAASVVALSKKESGISIGNIIGSNIFNLAVVVGFAAIVSEFKISENYIQLFQRDILIMLGFTIILYPLVYYTGKKLKLDRFEGLVLLSLYISYLWYIFQ
ncbi:MAG: calcium/sodium antiporter [Flavobacteriaceae bacterium]|nr:calcium/sodium antiporter [Flavobacteriaceae bacterium]MCY4266916.1 calcium/sodium antiporter [Flavobacteriaceae bacterium]